MIGTIELGDGIEIAEMNLALEHGLVDQGVISAEVVQFALDIGVFDVVIFVDDLDAFEVRFEYGPDVAGALPTDVGFELGKDDFVMELVDLLDRAEQRPVGVVERDDQAVVLLARQLDLGGDLHGEHVENIDVGLLCRVDFFRAAL